MGHIREWVASHADVPKRWVTQYSGLQCEEYLSLVDGVWRTGTENRMGFRWLAREIGAWFRVGLGNGSVVWK